jgi:hypothetical protein
MSDYTINLSPNLVNMATEGSMDSSLLNGNSVQRTVNGIMVVKGEDRKIVGRIPDGGQFDDIIEGAKARINVFINNNYVDYRDDPGTSYSHEANNLLAFMDSVGISYNTFTDISESSFASLSGGTIVIPELEKGDLNPDLTVSSKSYLENGVYNGGKLVMFAPSSGDPLDVLNAVFGFSLVENYPNEPYSLTQAGRDLFPDESSTIPYFSATSSIGINTLPQNSVTIYEGDGGNQSVVTMIPYGDGKIYVLGWDLYNQAPRGNHDGGWNHLIESILKS